MNVSTFTRLLGTSDHEGGKCINGRLIGEKPEPQIVGYAELTYSAVSPPLSLSCGKFVQGSGTFHRAFLFDNGRMQDLNALIPASSGWYLEQAFGINDSGQIVGQGWIGGKHHAFLLLR